MRNKGIDVARGAKGAMPLPKCLENIAILCFERRFSKQNSVIRLKSNILALPNFWAGYATEHRHSKTTCPDLCHVQKDYAKKTLSQVRIKKRKNCASLVPRYATIERDWNVVNNGDKRKKTQTLRKALKTPDMAVLPQECLSEFLGFSSKDLGFLRFYCVTLIFMGVRRGGNGHFPPGNWS